MQQESMSTKTMLKFSKLISTINPLSNIGKMGLLSILLRENQNPSKPKQLNHHPFQEMRGREREVHSITANILGIAKLKISSLRYKT